MQKRTTSFTGADLKLIRILYGFETQEKFAEFMKCHTATIQRYENFDFVPSTVIGEYIEAGFKIRQSLAFVQGLRAELNTCKV